MNPETVIQEGFPRSVHVRAAFLAGGVRLLLPVFWGWVVLASPAVAAGASPERPNVLLIMTDDQGYGDLGFHGNPRIRTPNLDRLARQSVRLASFYVSPVCSPTRSSLLTGRYNYRTGVVDTFQGRSLMHPDEVTLAEMLAAAGYRTGIFGKWHLGDNAPLRAIDQGFQEALVIKGGGIGQASDPPGGSSYFDPVLQHNGQAAEVPGLLQRRLSPRPRSISSSAADDRPFFAYLAFNCPHSPYEAPPAELAQLPRDEPASRRTFPSSGIRCPASVQLGREPRAGLRDGHEHRLERGPPPCPPLRPVGWTGTRSSFSSPTTVPPDVRFNAGLRGLKGTVYEGGIHVPCFIRWPGQLAAGRVVDRIAAHIDMVPTLLEACGVAPPAGVRLDGKSLLPLLRGGPEDAWPDRTLFFQWHRGDRPEPGRAFAARSQQYKLLRPEPPRGQQQGSSPGALRHRDRSLRAARHRPGATRDRRAHARGVPGLVPGRGGDARV